MTLQQFKIDGVERRLLADERRVYARAVDVSDDDEPFERVVLPEQFFIAVFAALRKALALVYARRCDMRAEKSDGVERRALREYGVSSRHVRAGGPALQRGVGQNGENAPRARTHIDALTVVARGVHVGQARALTVVHDDAAADCAARLFDELDVGAHAHRRHEHVERDLRAARKARRVAGVFRDAVAEYEPHALLFELSAHQRSPSSSRMLERMRSAISTTVTERTRSRIPSTHLSPISPAPTTSTRLSGESSRSSASASSIVMKVNLRSTLSYPPWAV